MRSIIAILGAVGAYCSIFLGVAIFAVGLVDITFGVVGLILETKLFPIGWHLEIMTRPAGGLSAILKGLELLFLAPAVALTFASTVVFLKAKIDHLLWIMISTAATVPAAQTAHENIITREMHSVKLSVTGLMISVLLTDLIGRVISNSALGLWPLAGSGLGTVLCLSYYVLLSRTDDSIARMPYGDTQAQAAHSN